MNSISRTRTTTGTRTLLQRLRLFLLDYPLLLREVRTRMRGTRTFVIVFVYDLLLIGFMALVYAEETAHPQYTNVELGRSIFGLVSYAQLVLMLLIAPATTSGSISAERERRSLDVMAISLLTPREIVWGKLLASVSFSLILLLSSVPLIGMCFMFGGLGPIDLIKSMTLIIVSILFFSSMAIFFSSVCKRTVVAVVLTFVGVLVFTIGIPLLVVLCTEVFRGSGGRGSTDEWIAFCMMVSSPFALATIVMPNEVQSIPLHDAMWAIHPGLHGLLSVAWLLLAARFVAYPRRKE